MSTVRSLLRRTLTAALAVPLLALGACTDAADDPSLDDPSLDDPSLDGALDDAPARGCPALDEFERRGDHLLLGDMDLGTAADVARLCAERAQAAVYGVGTNQGARKWSGGVVPYRISPDYPFPDRVEAAMKDWTDHTDAVRFVAYDPAAHDDWVEVVTDVWPNAEVGRKGGRQELRLSVGETPANIRAVAIGSNDWVFTWYADRTMTIGTSTDPDAYYPANRYYLPPGYAATDIVESAFASDGKLYTWYLDGKVSVGVPEDLDAYEPPHGNYGVLAGRSRAMIVGIGIAAGDVVVTWYSDNSYSLGQSWDLALYSGNQPSWFDGPTNPTVIRGIDFAADNKAYTWFGTNGFWRMVGTPATLNAHGGPLDVSFPPDSSQSTIAHELGHTLGLKHEQSRCDRDVHLRVYYANILPGRAGEFDKACWYNSDYGAHDVASIMHYSSGAFSSNGSPTMLRRPPPGLELTDGEGAAVIDMAIASDDHVYTWWSDGTVTAGTSSELEYHRSRYPFTLPGDRTVQDLVGLGISTDDHVYAFYRDGKVSVGTSDDLAAFHAPYTYTLPFKPGTGVRYQPDDIKSIGIASDDHVYVWFEDGKVAAGTSDDLGHFRAPQTYVPESGYAIINVRGIDISSDDTVYSWYQSGVASQGTTTNLGADTAPYAVRGRGLRIGVNTQLSSGDITTIETIY